MISHTHTHLWAYLWLATASALCLVVAKRQGQRQRRLLPCQFFTLVHKYLLQLNFAGNRNAICTINSMQHLPATPLWHRLTHTHIRPGAHLHIHTQKRWNLKNEVRLEQFCVFIKMPTVKRSLSLSLSYSLCLSLSIYIIAIA